MRGICSFIFIFTVSAISHVSAQMTASTVVVENNTLVDEADIAVDTRDVNDPCAGLDDCTVVVNCDDESVLTGSTCNVQSRYGGIKETYVVNECKVTIYNDGPIGMENIRTGEFCNAPIPEGHDFGGTKHVYEEDGCMITEYVNPNGITSGVADCPSE